jgi:hypothetical protein
MANFDRFPDVRAMAHSGQLSDIETLVVGKQVDVGVYRSDSQMGPHSEPAHQLVSDTAREVLQRLGLEDDESLALVCSVVGRAVVGRLVTSEGFEVRHGTYSKYTERVDVQLRTPEPAQRRAEVTRTQGEQ